MAEIKRFFECLIPVTVCNLKCDYCYVIQREQNLQKIPELDFPPETIGAALTKKRLGGICYFSICGAGETFAANYLIDIVYQLLKNGHFVNITTNGTLTNRIKKLSNIPSEWLSRLHISFSLHYLELKRLNLTETFFSNVNYVKALGCSFIVQLNLYDGYMPYIDEIKELCLQNVGAYPQIAATRKEESLSKKIDIMSDKSIDEYRKIGESFESPLFDFTMKNFNVPRTEFCYAGAWAYTLNLKTGILKRCYASAIHQNIFEDIHKPIMNIPVGNECDSLFFLNSSHFMSLGVIPEVNAPTYAELRNRKTAGWYTKEMENFLNTKLRQSNKECSFIQKCFYNLVGKVDKAIYKSYRILKNKTKR